MAFASHLGPWLLGTVKNTTGTTAGTIRNMGATIVAQTAAVTLTDGAGTQAFVLPAGALITNVQFQTTTVFDAASTIVVSIGGTAVNSAATITSVGVANIAPNTAGTPIFNNVGSTDAIVTYTLSVGASTTGAGTLVVSYIVRDSNGSQNPTAFQN